MRLFVDAYDATPKFIASYSRPVMASKEEVEGGGDLYHIFLGYTGLIVYDSIEDARPSQADLMKGLESDFFYKLYDEMYGCCQECKFYFTEIFYRSEKEMKEFEDKMRAKELARQEGYKL